MGLDEYLNEINDFLKTYLFDECHMDMYVLGLSGGVDSSLVATLAKKAVGKDHLLCLIIPIYSNKEDVEDAVSLAKQFDIKYEIVDASDIFDSYMKLLPENTDRATKSNLKARIRMSILYAYAQINHGLVLGTDNADERYTGYFTKYGDGACDLLPIAHLLKSEVVEAAKIMGVPTYLAERVPTAGLFQGQTDEGEMGVKYVDLDNFLLGKEVDAHSKERILHLHSISEHKRKDIPTPKEFIRN